QNLENPPDIFESCLSYRQILRLRPWLLSPPDPPRKQGRAPVCRYHVAAGRFRGPFGQIASDQRRAGMKPSLFDQTWSPAFSSMPKQRREDCKPWCDRLDRRRRDSVYFDFFAWFGGSSNAVPLARNGGAPALKSGRLIKRPDVETSGI